MNTAQINYTQYLQLKKVYAQAVKDKKDTLVFRNQQLITDYAKYLIELLDTKFKKVKK